MAFFGYPEAHDNDAERAARAGLAIIEAIAKLNEQPGRPKLSARVGIHSGAVVVGVGPGKDADVFGDAPNIAARVQEAAAPGTVVITEDTHRLVSGLFVFEARGGHVLKRNRTAGPTLPGDPAQRSTWHPPVLHVAKAPLAPICVATTLPIISTGQRESDRHPEFVVSHSASLFSLA